MSLFVFFLLIAMGLGISRASATVFPIEDIIGGNATTVAQFPYIVALVTLQGRTFCAGSVLSSRVVLTARHCMEIYSYDQIRVVGGVTSVKLWESDPQHQVLNIRAVASYPGFKKTVYGKDLALLYLVEPGFNLSDSTSNRSATMAPIQLLPSSSSLIPKVTLATIAGWGTISIPPAVAIQPDALQRAVIPILSLSQAITAYTLSPEAVTYPTHINDDQLPAGLLGLRDACTGDSGGPLTVDQGGKVLLAGITSWGEGCASPTYPGMYTRVPRFLTWIDNGLAGFEALSDKTGAFIDVIVAVNAASPPVAQGEFFELAVPIPSGATMLVVETDGARNGGGDVDVYVSYGRRPSLVFSEETSPAQDFTDAYECASLHAGSFESCVIPRPRTGLWYVGLRAYEFGGDVRTVNYAVRYRLASKPLARTTSASAVKWAISRDRRLAQAPSRGVIPGTNLTIRFPSTAAARSANASVMAIFSPSELVAQCLPVVRDACVLTVPPNSTLASIRVSVLKPLQKWNTLFAAPAAISWINPPPLPTRSSPTKSVRIRLALPVTTSENVSFAAALARLRVEAQSSTGNTIGSDGAGGGLPVPRALLPKALGPLAPGTELVVTIDSSSAVENRTGIMPLVYLKFGGVPTLADYDTNCYVKCSVTVPDEEGKLLYVAGLGITVSSLPMVASSSAVELESDRLPRRRTAATKKKKKKKKKNNNKKPKSNTDFTLGLFYELTAIPKTPAKKKGR